MGEPLTIRKLMDRITSGDIRIPAFQRDFVWEPDQVAFLLDSIYKEFPIGTVILWKTDERLNSEKKLGAFRLPEPQKDYPVNYVLDGQQRITSIFSAFQTELTPEGSSFVDVYFDMDATTDMQDSLFLALEPGEVDTNRHFPVKTLFDSVGYRQATAHLGEDKAKVADKLQERFKEYLIPNETFESGDRNKVAIVFERINRAGTPLEIFELLTAWSWSDQFDLVDKFKSLQVAIAEHGYEELGDDQDLLLRICAGIISGKTTPADILALNGDEIRSNFEKIERGIVGAIDFLKRELGVQHYRLLPFPGLMVPLSVFFATDKVEGFPYTAKQKKVLQKWFWRSLFTRRFSSDVNERQAHDLAEFTKLRENQEYEVRLPRAETHIFWYGNFSAGNANSKVVINLLNALKPRSFVSGARIDLSKILKKSSKHEYHHFFPKKHLERESFSRSSANILANICFLTRSDNNCIRDKDPKVYLEEYKSESLDTYLAEAMIPKKVREMDYGTFIDERVLLFEQAASTLMEDGELSKPPVEKENAPTPEAAGGEVAY